MLALSGDLGAGKTTLARAIIRSLAGDASLEVPSPTFTLVQTYDARMPVRHFDLYRLSGPGELDELGLDEARDDGAVLVEWPERAGNSVFSDAVRVVLSEAGGGRVAEITGPPGRLPGLSAPSPSAISWNGWIGPGPDACSFWEMHRRALTRRFRLKARRR